MKSLVGYKAVDDYVEPGFTVAVGSGSTAYYAIERISQLLATGDLFGITVIPTSEFIKKQCIAKGIPVATLSTAPNIPIDVVIDGTDEIDAKLCLNKGGSGSILREKMTQQASKHVIILADDSKLVRHLGTGCPLPIEITPFSHEFTRRVIESATNAKAVLRRGLITNSRSDGADVAVTDNGNFIVDVFFENPIADAEKLASELDKIPGVVEHGLCPHAVDTLIVGSSDGIRVLGKFEESNPWWNEKPEKKNFSRLTVDNRQIQ